MMIFLLYFYISLSLNLELFAKIYDMFLLFQLFLQPIIYGTELRIMSE